MKRSSTILFWSAMAIAFIIGFAVTQGNTDFRTKASTITTRRVGAYFFYWNDCPTGNCDTTKMPFRPSTLAFNSARNLDWYKREFVDMVAAKINIVIPVSWGSYHPTFPWFRDTQAVPLMVRAVRELNLPLKFALLDDTNSVVSEWNQDQGRGYTNPTENPSIPKMPLSYNANWAYFYDRKIKPFYSMVPRDLWETHNTMGVEQGGRPIILVYDAYRSFADLPYSDEMWYAIKNAFKADFKTSQGVGIEPFVILDYSWFDFNTDQESLARIVDGKFIWAGGNDTVVRQHTLNGYTTASIDPGFVCPTASQYTQCQSKPRNIDPQTGVVGDEASRLRRLFVQYAYTSNLILLETWNELWEGTGIQRAVNYPKNQGGVLPANYYVRYVSTLVRTLTPTPTIAATPTLTPSPTHTPTPTPTSVPTPTHTAAPTPIPTVGGENISPRGSFDIASCDQITGWACDPNDLNASVYIDVYKDGPFGQGGQHVISTTANLMREEAVGQLCGGNRFHGFVIQTPASLKDGLPHPLYIYPHNIPAGAIAMLDGSPKTIQCAP